MGDRPWTLVEGEGPVVAVANHDGHELRPEVASLMALSEADRLREEDPYTAAWTTVATTRLVPQRSRFEIDLNRSRESAVYRTPEDAWGLEVWRSPPSDELIARSLACYDAYYEELRRVCEEKARRHGKFLVLDLHSYNHRRAGPNGPAADPSANPEVNIGTGTMQRERWAGLVDRFIAEVGGFEVAGRKLDVRENVKFYGRQFPSWVHGNFPESGCALAIEFKKFFMDEWSGELDQDKHQAIQRALEATLPGLHEELAKLGARY